MGGKLGAALLVAAVASCNQAAPSLTLLFLGRSPAATLGGLSWAPDPDSSRIVGFDGALEVRRSFTSARLATPMAVAPLGSELLVSERMGQAVVFDTSGLALREWESPDPADIYAARDSRVVSARSPYFVPFAAEPDTAPLLRLLDTLGRPRGRLGTVHFPRVALLAEVTNAGAVTMDETGAVYFAPLARDEITKYDVTGAPRWRTTRGLFARESDPEFVPPRGARREIDARYPIVNIALAIGPDGRLYVLGASDSGATTLRVDALDTASGTIVGTRALGARETAVAVTRAGRLETFNAESLLAPARGATRHMFEPSFALPDLRGDTVRLATFQGKVALVNFWASWCDPCREEFPRMGELFHAFRRRDFAIVAISDDVDQAGMARFVREFRPSFPILVGGGRMKATYHYRGLPYSVLLDRRGRIIERIFGFGGAEEFRTLRRTIANEVRSP
jgi:thiol-disulfide isomerase/thioredoxin